jgi:molybdopterin-guanine dinucleotide biosynthesis protein A
METVEGFILIGGQSSRMGTNKALLKVEGQTLVSHVAGALRGVTSAISLVGGGTADHWPDLKKVPDVYDRWGALGGLHAALSAATADWAFVIACDLPFVTASLLAFLSDARAGFDAVAPIQRDDIPQPLCALYRITPCMERASKLIDSGERRPIALLQSVRTRWVNFSEIANLEDADRFFVNINTPEDFARASAKGDASQNHE